MKIVPKLVASAGAVALTAGVVAFTPTVQPPEPAQALALAPAAPAFPVSLEVELAAITDIFSWAYWVSVAPWAFVPLSVFTTAPVPPEEFVPPTFGSIGETIQSVYASTQPWGEFAVDYSAYLAGWVPLGVGFVQPELVPVVLALIVYSVLAPTIYDIGEAFWGPAVNAIAGFLGAPPTETPETPEPTNAFTLANVLRSNVSPTSEAGAAEAKTDGGQTITVAIPQQAQIEPQAELVESVPAAVDAAAPVVTPAVDAVTDVPSAETGDENSPAEDAVSATTRAVTDVAAGGIRVTKSLVAAPGTVATATVKAQGEVRGGVTEAVTDVADAVTSGDRGSVRDAVTAAPSTVTDGLQAGARDLADGVRKAGDDVSSAVAGAGER